MRIESAVNRGLRLRGLVDRLPRGSQTDHNFAYVASRSVPPLPPTPLSYLPARGAISSTQARESFVRMTWGATRWKKKKKKSRCPVAGNWETLITRINPGNTGLLIPIPEQKCNEFIIIILALRGGVVRRARGERVFALSRCARRIVMVNDESHKL